MKAAIIALLLIPTAAHAWADCVFKELDGIDCVVCETSPYGSDVRQPAIEMQCDFSRLGAREEARIRKARRSACWKKLTNPAVQTIMPRTPTTEEIDDCVAKGEES